MTAMGNAARNPAPRSLTAIVALVLCLTLMPLTITSQYALTVLINALIFTILSMSLNVIYGYAGLLSFAQVGFWGLGGYVAAVGVTKLGVDHWLATLAAIVLCSALSAGLAGAALRLSNHAFVIVSIAFTLLMQILSQEWISVTNGPMGIPGLPPPALGTWSGTFMIDTPLRFYYLVLSAFLTSMTFIYAVLTSRAGRTLRLINHDEALARSFGFRVTRWKLFASAFSAGFAALAGSLNVFFLTIVDPTIFDIYYTQLMIVIVIIGGLGSFWPVIVAGFLLTLLPEFLRTSGEIRMVYYGFILICAIMFFPRGLSGLWQRYRGSRAAADLARGS